MHYSFRKNIRMYNSALAVASVRAQFVLRGPGPWQYSPAVMVHMKMYHEIGALEPATGMLRRFASVHIHDTEHETSNKKHFHSSLREILLNRLAVMLEENNNSKSFVSPRKIIQRNRFPDDVKLVIHSHERTIPGHVRKYNVPETSEVTALVVGEHHEKIDIFLKRHSEFDANGYEKLELINFGHRMYNPFAYPLLFPYRKYGWICALKHKDSKGNSKKFRRWSSIYVCCSNEHVTSMYPFFPGDSLSNIYVKCSSK